MIQLMDGSNEDFISGYYWLSHPVLAYTIIRTPPPAYPSASSGPLSDPSLPGPNTTTFMHLSTCKCHVWVFISPKLYPAVIYSAVIASLLSCLLANMRNTDFFSFWLPIQLPRVLLAWIARPCRWVRSFCRYYRWRKWQPASNTQYVSIGKEGRPHTPQSLLSCVE